MAHFARLDENNIVTQVVVVNNQEVLDEHGQEQESVGANFLVSLYGPSSWKQCSYNDTMRGRYPAIGSEYIPESDVFSDLSPYPSWVLNRSTGLYEAPVEKPNYDHTTHRVYWDEPAVRWVIEEIPEE